jgi:hypothetical protein
MCVVVGMQEVSVAGAGYVNVKIRDEFLKSRIR